jgi:NADH-quinone oxidoreductase subunit C
MPDYDPLSVSDEERKALPAAERGAVCKARANARSGGAAFAPAHASSGTTPARSTPVTTAVASAVPVVAEHAAKAPDSPKKADEPKRPAFVQALLQAIPNSTWQWRHGYAEMKVVSASLLDAATVLRHAGFDYLSFITEVDWLDHLELIYHLFAYDYTTQRIGAILRCDLPRDGMPTVASVTSVWPGAQFMEREAFEMMGIRFLGHPDLRRILLPDDFMGFPMRRDYVTDFDYITVKQLVRESD